MLRVLVFGSGFAGEGHTTAFRSIGAEVVGMVGRTRSVVEGVTHRLSIPYSSTDLAEALEDLSPDIVSVATPGGAHLGPILCALDHGCHVYCDKPLAANAADARAIADAAATAGVKTAYAASFCYEPSVLHAEQLVATGAVGAVRQLEFVSHYEINPLIPWHWSHSLAAGGGRLNNNFTHKLAIALRITGGRLISVAGECRNDLGRVPSGPRVHDFRSREDLAPTPEEASSMEWREVDSDWSYTVLARIDSGSESHSDSGAHGGSGGRPETGRPIDAVGFISATFRHGGLESRVHPDYISVSGSRGTIWIDGAYGQGSLRVKGCGSDGQDRQAREWASVATPQDILARTPDLAASAERNWASLAREFCLDIAGESHEPYLNFSDGAMFQEAIAAVREAVGWHQIAAP